MRSACRGKYRSATSNSQVKGDGGVRKVRHRVDGHIRRTRQAKAVSSPSAFGMRVRERARSAWVGEINARMRIIALAQGGAEHYLRGRRGVRDLDVIVCFADDPRLPRLSAA